MSLIVARLTDEEFELFHQAHIGFSGSTGKRHPTPQEPYNPYIATYEGNLPIVVHTLHWQTYVTERHTNQTIIYRPELTFGEVIRANLSRVERWHSLASWSPLEWAGAMCGEAGEAANFAK